MVWLDGDNNLEGNAVFDFNEMEYGLFLAQKADPEIIDKLNIVVQFDRIEGWDSESHDSGPNWTDTRRYLVLPDPSPNENGLFVSLKLATQGEVNMGDAAELKNFIDFCKASFPARSYMLVLWNHGGGVRAPSNVTETPLSSVKGVASDETSGKDWLYTAEITDVLTDAESVDVIGFDACLMGMAEVAYEYKPGVQGKFGADYMVASAPEEGMDGWEYYKVFERFGETGYDAEGDPYVDVSTLSASELTTLIVKEYADSITHQYTSFPLNYDAMAAFDLSKIENVKSSLDILASKLQEFETKVVTDIQGDISNPNLMNYFPLLANYWIITPGFDLYDFGWRVYSGIPGAQAEAQALMDAVDSCVISSWANPDHPRYTGFSQGKNGLAFFFPGDGTYAGNNYYWYEWWYTAEDTNDWGPTAVPEPLHFPQFEYQGYNYGKLDFCNGDLDGDADGSVETWRELLESWYDPDNLYTPGTW